ncbi:hypothetical protein BG011_009502 [Mortierella polycephala]|uniref:Uncharacterized protein n=1 Tax=Mortierella polycephala TaxID=41804 RepID=A0A9P6TW81_9FUNG|nr:hypothetical protein BG011_009502 [Mortierella polycephala]
MSTSLFQICVTTIANNLLVYGSLQGLLFDPFGKAIYQEFVSLSNQFKLSSEERQIGLILFAEAYGLDELGPEFTGLRCSRVRDIPYLPSFVECLVYLDLSGGVGSSEEAHFTDKDMAGLASLSQLRILNLAFLSIGDTGLSHLVRSITDGTSGPVYLEYLNISHTDVTDFGFTRLFVGSLLVFPWLLGIDFTSCSINKDTALRLLRGSDQRLKNGNTDAWRRIEHGQCLFPTLRTDEQKRMAGRIYKEADKSSPMQKWVDCLNRQPDLNRKQAWELNLGGEDGLGISESLAIAKLNETYFQPAPDPPPFPLAVSEDWTIRKKKKQYNRKKDKDHTRTDNSAEKQPYDHLMYKRVLISIRGTFGVRPSLPDHVWQEGNSSKSKMIVACVRDRNTVGTGFTREAWRRELSKCRTVTKVANIAPLKPRLRVKNESTSRLVGATLNETVSWNDGPRQLDPFVPSNRIHLSERSAKRKKLFSGRTTPTGSDQTSSSHLPTRRRKTGNTPVGGPHLPFVKS